MNPYITLLIVDDEQTIREGLRHLIPYEKEGFQIIGEAANGIEAINQIQQYRPDIIITDMIMPEMDGLELTKVIQEQFPEIHILVLSSYDEFTYVSQSFKNGVVDYILKPMLNPKNLLEALTAIARKIKKSQSNKSERDLLLQSINRLLSGYPSENIEHLKSALSGPFYQLIYTNMQWYQNRDQLRSFLNSELFLANETQQLFPYFSNNGDAGLIISSQSEMPVTIADVEELFASIGKTEKDAFFVLSNPFSDIEQLTAEFNALKNASSGQRFYFKNMLVIDQKEIFQLNDEAEFDTKKFLRAILDNDYSLGLTRITDFFNQMILALVAPSYLKQQASSIFYTFISSLENSYPDNDIFHQLKMTFFKDINQADYLEDFSQVILQTIDTLRAGLQRQTQSEKNEDELVNDISQYIKRNYQKNLSLSQLAEHFHFSYNYLSTFFSKHFNTSFSDYLNQVRLQAAKKLLVSTQLNLSEISDATGYSDLSYFSRIFKKEFGVTPSKYRRENRL